MQRTSISSYQVQVGGLDLLIETWFLIALFLLLKFNIAISLVLLVIEFCDYGQ